MRNDESFKLAYEKAVIGDHERYNIGTYKERTRHLFLKYYYEPNASFHEVFVLGHVADIFNDNGIIEIQTSGLGSLKRKLEVFLSSGNNVKIVYPVSYRKRICRINSISGESTYGYYRTYPKSIYRIFSELLKISDYFPSDKLSLDIVLTVVTEVRKVSDKPGRHGSKEVKVDTVPEEIIDILTFRSLNEMKCIFPFEAGSVVTQKDISKAIGMTRLNLWCAIKLLIIAGIISENEPSSKRKCYTVL